MREEIERAGRLDQLRPYMQMALYEPGLGYYSAGARKLGAAGRLRHRARSGAGVQPLPRRAVRGGAAQRSAAATCSSSAPGRASWPRTCSGTRAARRAAAPLPDPRRERRPARAPAGRRSPPPCRACSTASSGWTGCPTIHRRGRRQRVAGRHAGRTLRDARRVRPCARRHLAPGRLEWSETRPRGARGGGATPSSAIRARPGRRATRRRSTSDWPGWIAALAATLDARRAAVRRLRPAAARVLCPGAARRHAAVSFPPPLPRRSLHPTRGCRTSPPGWISRRWPRPRRGRPRCSPATPRRPTS